MSVTTDLLAKRKFTLNPPQKSVFPIIENSDRNLVISWLTGSGKSLPAELSMLKAVKQGKKAIYLAPLKSLCSEKFEYFNEHLASGINVTIRYGDYDADDNDLTNYDIIVATYEKMDSLVRHKAKWLGDVGLICIDEAHSIGDKTRGSTLEILITRLMFKCPTARIVCLTAVMQNAKDLADWLDADFNLSTWRAVPLEEGVAYWGGENAVIKWKNGEETKLKAYAHDTITSLALETIVEQQAQVLVFCISRKETFETARNLSAFVGNYLTPEEHGQLNMLAEHMGNRDLAEYIRNGVGVHNASLNKQQRFLIEEAFRRHVIKALTCTTTLAQGINMPARRLIVVNLKRFNPNAKIGEPKFPRIAKSEYSNICGRAGRFGLDTKGESVLVGFERYCKFCSALVGFIPRFPLQCPHCRQWLWYDDTVQSLQEYLAQPNEPIKSQLGDEFQMYSHVLSEVSIDQPITIQALGDFFKQTFGARFQNTFYNADQALQVNMKLGLIYEKNSSLSTSLMGRLVSMTYINPLTYGHLNHLLLQPKPFLMENWITNIVTAPDFKRGVSDSIDFTGVLKYWIDETDIECHTTNECGSCIKAKTGVGPGDVHLATEMAQWIANATHVIAAVNKKEFVKPLSELEVRLKYGVKMELVDLCKQPYVGRVIARKLFDNHITDRPLLKANIDMPIVEKICGRLYNRVKAGFQ